MHVIVGKGPVGSATASLLAGRGEQVRVISRGPAPESAAGVEHVQLDATDPQALAAACRGAVALYNCASPAYHRWAMDWPPLAASLLSAARSAGPVLVTLSNLYGYGPVTGPMTEDLPLSATGPKSRTRAEMWRQALAAHEAGQIRATEARASDYYGPGVTGTGHLAGRMLPRLLRGKPVRVLGDPDAAHSWTFVPDIAAALVRLGGEERAWGHAWHVPTAAPLSQRDAVRQLCVVAGVRPVGVGTTSWAMLRALGTVVPPLRGMAEIPYQFDRPVVLDSSRYTATFGDQPTPADAGLAATVAWWQRRLGLRELVVAAR